MKSSRPRILHLTLHRRYFAAARTKHIEYRSRSRYWESRLEGKQYDLILFRNGYNRNAPQMLVQFQGLRCYGRGPGAYYAIRLGRIIEIKRWSAKPPRR